MAAANPFFSAISPGNLSNAVQGVGNANSAFANAGVPVLSGAAGAVGNIASAVDPFSSSNPLFQWGVQNVGLPPSSGYNPPNSPANSGQLTPQQSSNLNNLMKAFSGNQNQAQNYMKQLSTMSTGAPSWQSVYDPIYKNIQTSTAPYFQMLGGIYNNIANSLTPDAQGNLPANAAIQAAAAQKQKNLQGDISTLQNIYNPEIQDIKNSGVIQSNTAQTLAGQQQQMLAQKARDAQLMTQASSKLGTGGADAAVTAAGNAAQQPYAQASTFMTQNLQNSLDTINNEVQSKVNELTGQEAGQVQSVQDQLNSLPFETNQAEQQWDMQLQGVQMQVVEKAMDTTLSEQQIAGTQAGTEVNAQVAGEKNAIDKISALLSGSTALSGQDQTMINNILNAAIGQQPKTTTNQIGPLSITSSTTGPQSGALNALLNNILVGGQ